MFKNKQRGDLKKYYKESLAYSKDLAKGNKVEEIDKELCEIFFECNTYVEVKSRLSKLNIVFKKENFIISMLNFRILNLMYEEIDSDILIFSIRNIIMR